MTCPRARELRTQVTGALDAPDRPQRFASHVLEAPLKSILCVQPDRALQVALRQALSDYRVVLASTGLDAIRHLQTRAFDAYVLDYRLPPTSGIHLCRHIRRSDPRAPVCFYAETGSEQQRNRAFKAGASAYVVAAAGLEALREELHGLLGSDQEQSSAGGEERVPRADSDRLENLPGSSR